MAPVIGPLQLRVEIERWPLVAPFRITGFEWDVLDTVLVTLQKNGNQGRGEASGVYYRDETAASMVRQLESVRSEVEQGVSRDSIQAILPAGGARCALDCALWDLESKITARSAWEIAGIKRPEPLRATYTCSADEPEKMAAAARSMVGARAIKLKLTGEASDAARVHTVRAARPDVVLRVDANQGFTLKSFEKLLPALVEAEVQLIEQPFPVGQEALLDGLRSPIPLAADESVQCLSDMTGLVGRFEVVNIKLEKCGGFTEGLAMARAAQKLGLKTMVGNMLGTSLAMAPGYLLGQLCDVVELDGPLALKSDRSQPVRFFQGEIVCPTTLWGSAMGRNADR